ncbi:hypothetical protein BD779DRAFT_1801748 [Infundibulicybe gibba]|nr:hypothetical protein BD779DRAFT_1801748 [Infundibulicybe gibba]
MFTSSLANWDGSMSAAQDKSPPSSKPQLPVFPIRNPEGALPPPPHGHGIGVGRSKDVHQGTGAGHGGAIRQWQSGVEYGVLDTKKVHAEAGMSISRRVADSEPYQDASKGTRLIKTHVDTRPVPMIRAAHSQLTQRHTHNESGAASRFRPKQPDPPMLFVPNGLLGPIVAPPNPTPSVPPIYEDRLSSADAEGEEECSDIEEIVVYKQPNAGPSTPKVPVRAAPSSNRGPMQQPKKPAIPTIRKPNFTAVSGAKNQYIIGRGPKDKQRQPESKKRPRDLSSPPLSPGRSLFTPPPRRQLPSRPSIEDLCTPPPSGKKAVPDCIYVSSSASPPPTSFRSRQRKKVLSHIEPPPFHPNKPKHSYRPMLPKNPAKARPSRPEKYGVVHHSLEVALRSSWQNNSALDPVDSVVEPSITILRRPQPAMVPSMNAVAGPSRIPIGKPQARSLVSPSVSLVGIKRKHSRYTESEDDNSNPFWPHRAGEMLPPPPPRTKRPYKKKQKDENSPNVAVDGPRDNVTKTRKVLAPNLATKYDVDQDLLKLYPVKTRPLSLDTLAFNIRFIEAMAGGSHHSSVFGKGKGKEKEVIGQVSSITASISWFQWPILEVGLDADIQSVEGEISIGYFHPWKDGASASQHQSPAGSRPQIQSVSSVLAPKATVSADKLPKKRPGRPPKSSSFTPGPASRSGMPTSVDLADEGSQNSHHYSFGIHDHGQSQMRNIPEDARFGNTPINTSHLPSHSYPSPTKPSLVKKRGRPPKQHAKPVDHIPPIAAPSATQPAETIHIDQDNIFHQTPSFARGNDRGENSLFSETPNGSHPLFSRSVIDEFPTSLDVDHDLYYPHDTIDPLLLPNHIDSGLDHSTTSMFPGLMFGDHRLDSPMKFADHFRPMMNQPSPTSGAFDTGDGIDDLHDLKMKLWVPEESPADQVPAFGNGTIDPSLLGDLGVNTFEPDPPSRSPSPSPALSVSSRGSTPEIQTPHVPRQLQTPSPTGHRRSTRERIRTTLPDMVDTAELQLSSSSSDSDYDSDSSIDPILIKGDASKKEPIKAPMSHPEPMAKGAKWPTCSDKTFCHQCRCTSTRVKMTCRECKKHYCIRCLTIRYTDVENPPVFEEGRTNFNCPACEGTCTCDQCTRKRGEVYVSRKKVGAAGEQVPKQQPIPMREPNKRVSVSTRPSPSPLPQITGPVTYWAAIYSITGEKVGTAFVGEDGNDDVVLAQPLKAPPPTKRVFIGRVEPSWGLGARPRLTKLVPPPKRKTEFTRLFVGNKRKLPRRTALPPPVYDDDADTSSLSSVSGLDGWNIGDSDVPSSPMKSSLSNNEERLISTGLEDEDVFRAIRLAFEALATVADNTQC